MPASTAEKIVPTSLKLPASVKAQIDETARKAGLSAHAFMVQTLSVATENARLREQFQQDALDALQQMDETGVAYDFEDAKTYFNAMSLYRQGKGARPARPAMVKI